MDGLSGFFGALLFWLLFLYLFLAPQLQHRALQVARERILERLADIRGSTVITLIHRQESVGFLGIPLYRYISIEDSEEVLRAIRAAPKDKPIDLIIHTPGGLVLAASQIAMALKQHPKETRVIIPHYAMSGGTLIALAADKIIMDPNAVLGPVDPQVGEFPAPSILRAVEMKGKEKVDDKTLILYDVSLKAINQVKSLVYELLKDKLGDEKAKEVAEILTSGKWTHDYPITVEEARSLGLPVSTDVPPEVYELMELYKQPVRYRPESVEFVPPRATRARETR